ncbi:cob(I)yrinic acid a,c-diamide adenosyltransferase [Virgibacillus profundi]|uniref:Cob(I)yrinic acid a,c-diamide adenosyltransferase n=1 Tax=Virgibacillus profundi TaxID=2024555 RepID=A0A2A2I8U7_9BACI|nr:cob(I)yrinic acid a,c-diamide adenosyltransferase [Virgibacillus profundi]PAV27992.1 cob(I)yrinic acid a,c-diamide adenosyltransferase [Virgibacillus profundi]PXY52170.1 cob(I)yrinic acid a,c-diamide adenosyltransferase [Virgibacillus profundi]
MGRNKRNGLTLVYTGDGKGKTTAAVGLAVRAAGREFKVKMLQFIKSPRRTYGEKYSLEKLGIEMDQLGIGFTWLKTPEEHREALKKAWPIARDTVMSGEYDLVILDELNNALAIDSFPIDDVLPLNEVIDLIKNKPSHVHLVITGRDAKQEIRDAADLVSVVGMEKHYYNEGVNAIKGIEL